MALKPSQVRHVAIYDTITGRPVKYGTSSHPTHAINISLRSFEQKIQAFCSGPTRENFCNQRRQKQNFQYDRWFCIISTVGAIQVT